MYNMCLYNKNNKAALGPCVVKEEVFNVILSCYQRII